MFMDREYSIYQINMENFIDLVSKSTWKYHKNKYKKKSSFEWRSKSNRKPKFDESVKLKIIDIVTNDPYKVSNILNMSF